jgi:hypothetical protein
MPLWQPLPTRDLDSVGATEETALRKAAEEMQTPSYLTSRERFGILAGDAKIAGLHA